MQAEMFELKIADRLFFPHWPTTPHQGHIRLYFGSDELLNVSKEFIRRVNERTADLPLAIRVGVYNLKLDDLNGYVAHRPFGLERTRSGPSAGNAESNMIQQVCLRPGVGIMWLYWSVQRVQRMGRVAFDSQTETRIPDNLQADKIWETRQSSAEVMNHLQATAFGQRESPSPSGHQNSVVLPKQSGRFYGVNKDEHRWDNSVVEFPSSPSNAYSMSGVNPK
ncbi:uncharacterized protein EI90DRAFT_3293275 [Cantharellus anzutake]|uniref:uncharacterized protein n=1 Tax=Cantharellus anzutake TaxID=1750568 RepID=UPI001904050E|nr:uncharacterized protein EI90DRAFT_3293275 [Cantharellus anzutake]KAF8318325.1 hypothetical protein EI90DRAFT_3293275 [Cantharellus anzutake]